MNWRLAKFIRGAKSEHEFNTAAEMRAEIPSGWHKVFDVFRDDVNMTQMQVVSLNLGMYFIFQRQPGQLPDQ